jgi:DNA-binding PadR family transcriptional regulator
MYINDNELDSDDDKDEPSDYLIKKEVRSSINPLNWWEDKKVEYPILSSLARQYLVISSTSVPSERLFSDKID